MKINFKVLKWGTVIKNIGIKNHELTLLKPEEDKELFIDFKTNLVYLGWSRTLKSYKRIKFSE